MTIVTLTINPILAVVVARSDGKQQDRRSGRRDRETEAGARKWVGAGERLQGKLVREKPPLPRSQVFQGDADRQG
jgi:hypothetical protein